MSRVFLCWRIQSCHVGASYVCFHVELLLSRGHTGHTYILTFLAQWLFDNSAVCTQCMQCWHSPFLFEFVGCCPQLTNVFCFFRVQHELRVQIELVHNHAHVVGACVGSLSWRWWVTLASCCDATQPGPHPYISTFVPQWLLDNPAVCKAGRLDFCACVCMVQGCTVFGLCT